MPRSEASLETSRNTQQPNSNRAAQDKRPNVSHPDPGQLSRPARAFRDRSQPQQPARADAAQDTASEDAQRPAQDEPRNQSPQTERNTLRDIFADDESGESHAGDGDDSTPDTVDALARRSGLSHEQLYAIKVAMPGGAEPLTIGELKDRVGKVVDLEQRELQFDQRRIRGEGELLRGQRELSELLQLLPKGAVSPEIATKLRERHNATLNRERALTLEHIPEWQNEERMTADVDGMDMWLVEEYGFAPGFVTTVTDHRALKFIRDMFKRDQRIKEALKDVDIPAARRGRTPSQRGVNNGKGGASRPGNSSSGNARRAAPVTERSRMQALLDR